MIAALYNRIVKNAILCSLITNILYGIFFLSVILLTLPFIILISIAILVSSGLPILYIHTRIGKKGKPFLMYKFRTMKQDADHMKRSLKKLNEADGPVFKIHNDPRFTKIGKFLSHTGLDELPQLLNVIQGDMSIVGPRPLPIAEACKLTKSQQKRYAIKPGIISPWILNGYHSKSFAEWMKSDVEYTKKKSILYDMSIFLKMIPYILKLFFHELSIHFV